MLLHITGLKRIDGIHKFQSLKEFSAELCGPALKPSRVVVRQVAVFLFFAFDKDFPVPIAYARRYTYEKRHKNAEHNVLQTVARLVLLDVERSVLVAKEKTSSFKTAPSRTYFKIDEVMEPVRLMPCNQQCNSAHNPDERHRQSPSEGCKPKQNELNYSHKLPVFLSVYIVASICVFSHLSMSPDVSSI